MRHTEDLELELARSPAGQPLHEEAAGLIRLYLNADMPQLWKTIASYVVYDHPPLQLWQAVEAIAPGRSGRVVEVDGAGRRTVRFDGAPPADIVHEALRFATH